MTTKFSGENTLTYLLNLIAGKFNTKVDKVEGKGLSTNDYTTAEKEKLAGIADGANNYVHPTHAAQASGLYKVTVDEQGHVSAVAAVIKDDITALGIPAQDTTYGEATADAAGLMSAADKVAFDQMVAASGEQNVQADWNEADETSDAFIKNKPELSDVALSGNYNDLLNIPDPVAISTDVSADAGDDTKAVSPKAVKTYVDTRVASVYRPQGSIEFASLPTPSADLVGYVYNVTDSFTTSDIFAEGAGHEYASGSNVVVVELDGAYKFDVLAGIVDLSGYVKTSDLQEFTNQEIQTMWDAAFTA